MKSMIHSNVLRSNSVRNIRNAKSWEIPHIKTCLMKKSTKHFKHVQTLNFHFFTQKNVLWKYVLEHISSNTIKHEFFFFFQKCENFIHTQTVQTFHQTSEINDVWWNVWTVCPGLKKSLSYNIGLNCKNWENFRKEFLT